MTTFDLADVRRYAADLDDRLDQCENGEGRECTNLDDTLRQYAIACCELTERMREWERAVFYGKAAFDPEVEKVYLSQGFELLRRGSDLWEYGKQKEDDHCFALEGGAALGAAIWQLERLLNGWTAPQRATSPVARQGISLSPEQMKEAQQRLAALPPLPAGWQPTDPRQQLLYRKLQSRS